MLVVVVYDLDVSTVLVPFAHVLHVVDDEVETLKGLHESR